MLDETIRLTLAAVVGGIFGSVGMAIGALRPLRNELHRLSLAVARLEERVQPPRVIIIAEERRKHTRERLNPE
jgi:hypothetical protein